MKLLLIAYPGQHVARGNLQASGAHATGSVDLPLKKANGLVLPDFCRTNFAQLFASTIFSRHFSLFAGYYLPTNFLLYFSLRDRLNIYLYVCTYLSVCIVQ